MARAYEFITLDVFTDRPFGGNPLAVFPDARGLDTSTMQALAGEFNLSETTFVLPPEDARHTAKVRIFTPSAEIGFAGHPNIGTAWVLAMQGQDQQGRLVFEGGSGPVDIDVERDGDELKICRLMAPQSLKLGVAPSAADLAPCARLVAADIGRTDVASVGLDCVCAEVSLEALGRAGPDASAFRAVADRWLGPQGRFLLCLYARDGDQLRSRVFGPLYGVTEDPACGSATAALAGLVLQRDEATNNRIVMHMGAEIGRPSVLYAGAQRGDDGVRVWLAGQCVEMMRGTVTV
ncbi:MAG: PhzF family phenazine biosynthesis protein [Rubrivivax sp.]|jgi:trans-2,3-dihydro-3-hydroxyanthranilate isomerase|nr:PhzF family phenazine biosynthesis protein [Rubrivivax sp.]